MSDIDLSNKKLRTLKRQRIPRKLDGYFNCSFNNLTSLEFCPEEVDDFFGCTDNKLTSLEFCATKINNCLYVNNNLITNLKGIHKQFKNGYITRVLCVQGNPIESHVLGVILIHKLTLFQINTNMHVERIIDKHMKSGKDILECQEELIQNGFKEFAKL